jgi:hypothetical protein
MGIQKGPLVPHEQLYDRRREELTLYEVELIGI